MGVMAMPERAKSKSELLEGVIKDNAITIKKPEEAREALSRAKKNFDAIDGNSFTVEQILDICAKRKRIKGRERGPLGEPAGDNILWTPSPEYLYKLEQWIKNREELARILEKYYHPWKESKSEGKSAVNLINQPEVETRRPFNLAWIVWEDDSDVPQICDLGNHPENCWIEAIHLLARDYAGQSRKLTIVDCVYEVPFWHIKDFTRGLSKEQWIKLKEYATDKSLQDKWGRISFNPPRYMGVGRDIGTLYFFNAFANITLGYDMIGGRSRDTYLYFLRSIGKLYWPSWDYGLSYVPYPYFNVRWFDYVVTV